MREPGTHFCPNLLPFCYFCLSFFFFFSGLGSCRPKLILGISGLDGGPVVSINGSGNGCEDEDWVDGFEKGDCRRFWQVDGFLVW